MTHRRRTHFADDVIWLLIPAFFMLSACSNVFSVQVEPTPIPHLNYIESLLSPDNESIFVLYDDSAFAGDQSWHIFKFDKSTDVVNRQIPSNYRGDEDGRWLAKQIMWNYSEGGYDLQDAHIDIIDESYLVFKRGGLYHSLYDIKTDRVLIEDHSPWHSWIEAGEYKALSSNASREEKAEAIRKWKIEAFHRPILDFIQKQ